MSRRIQVGLNTGNPRLLGDNRLAYAAGLFDGEGCVHIAKQRHRGSRRGYVYRLAVSIAQNHLGTLVDFQDLVGIAGRIYSIPRQDTANRDAYTLNYDGNSAAALLDLLGQFLGRKADEASIALEFQRNCHINTHFGPKGCPDHIWHRREQLYNKLRKLK